MAPYDAIDRFVAAFFAAASTDDAVTWRLMSLTAFHDRIAAFRLPYPTTHSIDRCENGALLQSSEHFDRTSCRCVSRLRCLSARRSFSFLLSRPLFSHACSFTFHTPTMSIQHVSLSVPVDVHLGACLGALDVASSESLQCARHAECRIGDTRSISQLGNCC